MRACKVKHKSVASTDLVERYARAYCAGALLNFQQCTKLEIRTRVLCRIQSAEFSAQYSGEIRTRVLCRESIFDQSKATAKQVTR